MIQISFRHSVVSAIAFGVTSFTILFTAPNRALAWGEVGHKTVARIAWDNLKPETRTKLIALLDAAPADSDMATLRPKGVSSPDSDRALFEAAASWPDFVKRNKTPEEQARRAKYNHSNWHYKDLFFEQDATTGKITERPDMHGDKEDSVERLSYLTPRLADVTVDASERGIDLAWIEHLVGDMSMPLHNVARITTKDPQGDQGGNKIVFEDKPAPGKQYPVNLHSYWDDIPETAFPLTPGEDPEARLGRVAAAATTALPKALFDNAGLNQVGHFDQWNEEGAEVARTKVYTSQIQPGQMPPATYAEDARQTVLVALAKAGYRLAATLEAAMSDK